MLINVVARLLRPGRADYLAQKKFRTEMTPELLESLLTGYGVIDGRHFLMIAPNSFNRPLYDKKTNILNIWAIFDKDDAEKFEEMIVLGWKFNRRLGKELGYDWSIKKPRISRKSKLSLK